jgi:hypothetical protein
MRVVRSEIPIFDRVKFAKVRAPYASTPYAGERHAAHRKATPPTARWNFSQEQRGSPLSRRPTSLGVTSAFSKFVQERQSYCAP